MQLLPRPSSKAISTDRRGPAATRRCRSSWSSSRRPRRSPRRRAAHGARHRRGWSAACSSPAAGAGPDQGRPRGDRAGHRGFASTRRWWCNRWRPQSCARSTCSRAKRCTPARSWHGWIPLSHRPISARWRPRWPTIRPRCRGCRPRCRRQAVRLCRARSEPVVAGGDLRAAPGGVRFQAGELQQKIDSLVAAIAKANADAAGYRDRLGVAQSVEQMRRELEKLQVGSQLNTLAAMDNRAEMARNLHSRRSRPPAPSATWPRGWPSATAMCNTGMPTSPTSWRTRSAS